MFGRIHQWTHLGLVSYVWKVLNCYFPGSTSGKGSACSAGDPSLIPGSGRSPREGNGNHSSIFAWKIPWSEELGGLQSHRSQRVGPDCMTKHTYYYLKISLVSVVTIQQKTLESIQIAIQEVFALVSQIILHYRNFSNLLSSLQESLDPPTMAVSCPSISCASNCSSQPCATHH